MRGFPLGFRHEELRMPAWLSQKIERPADFYRIIGKNWVKGCDVDISTSIRLYQRPGYGLCFEWVAFAEIKTNVL